VYVYHRITTQFITLPSKNTVMQYTRDGAASLSRYCKIPKEKEKANL
jgi:hypothetical protein